MDYSRRHHNGNLCRTVIMFRGIVPKMRKSLSFLATIQNDLQNMKTLAIISVLALLTIGGAAYTDQLFTSNQRTAQRVN